MSWSVHVWYLQTRQFTAKQTGPVCFDWSTYQSPAATPPSSAQGFMLAPMSCFKVKTCLGLHVNMRARMKRKSFPLLHYLTFLLKCQVLLCWCCIRPRLSLSHYNDFFMQRDCQIAKLSKKTNSHFSRQPNLSLENLLGMDYHTWWRPGLHSVQISFMRSVYSRQRKLRIFNVTLFLIGVEAFKGFSSPNV